MHFTAGGRDVAGVGYPFEVQLADVADFVDAFDPQGVTDLPRAGRSNDPEDTLTPGTGRVRGDGRGPHQSRDRRSLQAFSNSGS